MTIYLYVYDMNKKEIGNYYYGARYYDPKVSVWLSVDPLAHKYPSFSPYVFTGNNPIMLVDPDGREIDLSKLTPQQRSSYNNNIKLLSQNKLFATYYNRLVNSETTYYINSGSGSGGSGSFSPKTNDIHYVSLEALAQELFHAYQSDLSVYQNKDASVREAEGDIVSSNIILSLDKISSFNSWDEGIGFTYIDEEGNLDLSVLSEEFDVDFNIAVDNRIALYQNRENEYGAKAPESYVQENSGVGALALKKAMRETNATTSGLSGPRLSNGDYYLE